MNNSSSTSSTLKTALIVATIIIGILVLVVMLADLNNPDWTVFGQTTAAAVNGTSSPTTTTTTIASSTSPPATVGEVQSMDLANDATIATVGGAVATGLVAEFVQRRKKTGKIDDALKAKDKLIDDLYDSLWMIINKSMDPANAAKPFKEVILMKAFPENNLDTRTIADVINQKRDAFKQWYKARYVENPD